MAWTAVVIVVSMALEQAFVRAMRGLVGRREAAHARSV